MTTKKNSIGEFIGKKLPHVLSVDLIAYICFWSKSLGEPANILKSPSKLYYPSEFDVSDFYVVTHTIWPFDTLFSVRFRKLLKNKIHFFV